jgi:UDP-N-acetylmuramoyl-tripeptide--D-alanyl-D-alanine ligase
MKSLFKKIIVALITLEAKAILKKYKPKIVGITGSVGKTSTKDAIYAALSGSFYVRKSEKSYNTEFGVPLTIIGGQNGWSNPLIWAVTLLKGLRVIVTSVSYPEWLVLEIGADRPGDIKSLMTWVKPDIAVITRFGDVPVHVEFFKSRKALIEEKAHLAKALRDNGVLVLNADDEETLAMRTHSKGQLVTYGTLDATVQASNYSLCYQRNEEHKRLELIGLSFKANIQGSCLPIVRRGVIGEHHMYPALAALAVANALNVNLVSATDGLSKELMPPGRMRLIEGIKDSVIIDDTYNSSPVALIQALHAMLPFKAKKKRIIAVLGDMLELGKFSTEEHRKAGNVSARMCNILVAVGIRAVDIARGAEEAGMRKQDIHLYDNSTDAGRFLDHFVGENDVVLVKGSQGMRMERIVEEIMAHPEDREKLLVRQDAEWRRR